MPNNSNYQQHQADATSLGGHLVTINSTNEWNIIQSMFNQLVSDTPVNDRPHLEYYIGAIKPDYYAGRPAEGNWEWNTGEPMTVNFWYPQYAGANGTHGGYATINYEHGLVALDSYDGSGWQIDGYLLEIDAYNTTNNINTNPLLSDSDGDGLSDGYEVNASLSNQTIQIPRRRLIRRVKSIILMILTIQILIRFNYDEKR